MFNGSQAGFGVPNTVHPVVRDGTHHSVLESVVF